MGRPIKTEREKLDHQLEWFERWIVISGFAVAAGVFTEIGPKVFKRQVDSEVIGAAIVILGVAAEVILAFLASRKSSRIQEIADAETAAANQRAAEALERAANADLARVRLENKFQSRVLKEGTGAKLAEEVSRWKSLCPNTSHRVDIFIHDLGRIEVAFFSESLNKALHAAGIDSRMWPAGGDPRMGRDVTILQAKDCPANEKMPIHLLTAAIAAALMSQGILCSHEPDAFLTTDGPSLIGGHSQRWDPADVAKLRIQIQEKELVSWYADTQPITPVQA